MGMIGITTVKAVNFRSVMQEFSNTYYYQATGLIPAAANHSGLVDEVVATERSLHSTDVQFKRASLWSAGGTPSENQMLFQKDLSGTGNQAVNGSLDRERAFLIQWPAGLDIRGHPVTLKKWFHSCGNCAAVTISSGMMQQTIPIDDVYRTQIAAKAEELREIGGLETIGLCAKSGRENKGPAVCHKWLEHHQLGDQWR